MPFAPDGEDTRRAQGPVSLARASVEFVAMRERPEAQIETLGIGHRVTDSLDRPILGRLVHSLSTDHVPDGSVFADVYDPEDPIAACADEVPNVFRVAEQDNVTGENERTLALCVAVPLRAPEFRQVDLRSVHTDIIGS